MAGRLGVTPATQQAVETRHAEIMEAIFGQGEFFDIEDNIRDVNGNPIDIELIKVQLNEDFKKDKIRKAIGTTGFSKLPLSDHAVKHV